MITPTQVRTLMRAHHDVREIRRRDRPAFQIGDLVFATMPTERHLCVLFGRAHTFAPATRRPEVYQEIWWNEQLVGLRVDLTRADYNRVAELIGRSHDAQVAALSRPKPRIEPARPAAATRARAMTTLRAADPAVSGTVAA